MVVLPNLTYAYSIEIANASVIDLPVLQSVSQGMEISWNSIQNLSAPNLAYIGGSLNMTNNVQLDMLYLDLLVSVQGTLDVRNSPFLLDLGGVSSLSNIGGSLELLGDFTKYVQPCIRKARADDNISVSLASLQEVRGNALVQSSNIIDCSEVPSSIIQGTLTCQGLSSNTTITATPSASSSGNALSRGATAGIAVGVAVPLMLIAVAVGFCIWSRRRKAGKSSAPSGASMVLERSLDEDKHARLDISSPNEHDNTNPELGRSHSQQHQGPEGRHELPMVETAVSREVPFQGASSPYEMPTQTDDRE